MRDNGLMGPAELNETDEFAHCNVLDGPGCPIMAASSMIGCVTCSLAWCPSLVIISLIR